MFVKLGGRFLKVAGKFAKSLACCCGYNPDQWKCLLSSDGSYRCDTEYDFEQDQLLSEHSSKEDCERFCGQDQVYCYYDANIGYYCTNYIDEGFLSGPYPDTITCNEACKQMWFCVDKGSSGGETQYECTLQDPAEDYLSGPYGSKDACEYRCGNLWWCTYKYINTDEYEYECVQDNTGAPDNAVSGPYGSDAECEVACQICEEIILPEQKPCPDCVDDACVYLAGEGGIDGGQWGTCCAGLIETWRYCNGQWDLIIPCSPIETRTAGTPACEVYPESLDFPDDPVEGQLYTVECDRVLGFDPSDYEDCEDCDYNCVENNGSYECELDPAGPHKTLQDCIDKCPEKWGCISTDECVQKPDGTYATETECVDNAPVDCGGGYPTGRCCVYTGEILDMACGETRQECEDDARRIAATDPNSFWSADNITQDTQPEADCPYYVYVYTIIPEASTPVCWDEDEDGNPVTQEFCDAQSEFLKDTRSVFTEGADCGEASIGGGTCPAVPPQSSFVSFAPPP